MVVVVVVVVVVEATRGGNARTPRDDVVGGGATTVTPPRGATGANASAEDARRQMAERMVSALFMVAGLCVLRGREGCNCAGTTREILMRC